MKIIKERVDGRQRGQTEISEASNSPTGTPHTSTTLSDSIISQNGIKSNPPAKKSFLADENVILAVRGNLRVVFDQKIKGMGFWFSTGEDGGYIILINPNYDTDVIEETLIHELAHDIESESAYEPLAALADRVNKEVRKKEIASRYYTYYLRKEGALHADSPTPEGIKTAIASLPENKRAELETLVQDKVRAHVIAETLTSEKHIDLFAGISPSMVARLWGRIRHTALILRSFSGNGAAYRTDHRNEPPNHSRKDDIVDFAKGTVLLRVGSNDYSADVIVGYTDKKVYGFTIFFTYNRHK